MALVAVLWGSSTSCFPPVGYSSSLSISVHHSANLNEDTWKMTPKNGIQKCIYYEPPLVVSRSYIYHNGSSTRWQWKVFRSVSPMVLCLFVLILHALISSSVELESPTYNSCPIEPITHSHKTSQENRYSRARFAPSNKTLSPPVS